MCGICVYLCRQQDIRPSEDVSKLGQALDQLKMHNAARGPDRQDVARTTISPQFSGVGSDRLVLECFASELQLRGDATVAQPHVRGGTVFCWNGEIFDGLEVLSNENDGVKLFEELCQIKSDLDIAVVLGRIEGPYAFVLYHADTQSVYFGRDPLGRRSLLVHWPAYNQPYFVLSSVSNGIDSDLFAFEELDTEWIFCIRLSEIGASTGITTDFSRTVHRVSRMPPSLHRDLSYAIPAEINRTRPEESTPEITSLDDIPDHLKLSVDRLITELDKSVRLQVQSIPQRSPGEARVAILFSGGIDSTALCYFADRHIPKNEPIDLLNVAFENPRKIRIPLEGNQDALPKRLKRQRKNHKPNGCASQDSISYMVPDRVSGLEELEELRRVCPGRVWNFVEINVPYNETQAAKAVVEAIMFPSRTVMDLSLSLALWFASRGVGAIKPVGETEIQPYTSTACVLLNGLGSDELLGGYGRHRSAFSQGGWPAVMEELEIDRIPTRNLGRDDRITSSHGKESRHPFLSLDVVAFLAKLPVHHKMDLRLKAGLGDKMLLRLATKKLGLELVSVRKKRAMQFGSHSARMDGERRGDVCLKEPSVSLHEIK